MRKKALAMLLAIILVAGVTAPMASAEVAGGDDPYHNPNHEYWRKDNPNGWWQEHWWYYSPSYLQGGLERGEDGFPDESEMYFGLLNNYGLDKVTPEALLGIALNGGDGGGLSRASLGSNIWMNPWSDVPPEWAALVVNPGGNRLKTTEWVIVGDCGEFVGDPRMVYADGTIVRGVKETFVDGERVTIVFDQTKIGMPFAIVVPYKVVNGTWTHDNGIAMYNATDGGVVASIAFGGESPYAPSRTGGVGSVMDIMYWTDEGYMYFTPNPNLSNNPADPGSNPANTTGPKYLDVSANHWGRANIISAYNKGLMTGVEVRPNGDIRFDPEGTLTRAQVAQILYNAYKDSYNIIFTQQFEIADVSAGAWYHDAIDWAVTLNLINTEPVDGKAYFRPDSPAPRWLVAVALHRLAMSKRNPAFYQEALPKVTAPMTFSDLADARYSAYLPAISALQQAGIIGGFPDGTFRPDDALTRAQAAKLIDMFTDIEGLASDAMKSNE